MKAYLSVPLTVEEWMTSACLGELKVWEVYGQNRLNE